MPTAWPRLRPVLVCTCKYVYKALQRGRCMSKQLPGVSNNFQATTFSVNCQVVRMNLKHYGLSKLKYVHGLQITVLLHMLQSFLRMEARGSSWSWCLNSVFGP